MTSASIPKQFPVQLLPKKITFGSVNAFGIFWIVLGALPLYLPFIMYIGEMGSGAQQPIHWVYWANFIISMPHTWSTYARLTRKMSEKKVHWAFGWPAYIATLAFLIIATMKGFFLEAFTAINVWQSYHYLRQSYGISRLFGRSEAETEFARKLSFWSYHAAMPLFIIGRWDLLYTMWGGRSSDFIIPVQFPHAVMNICWALAAVALALGLWSEAIKYKKSDKAYNCTGLLCLGMYFWLHWFGFISQEYFARGFLAITVFHAIQYIAVVWYLEDKQKSSPKFPTARLMRYMPYGLSFVAFWVAIFIIGDLIEEKVFTLGNLFWAQFSSTCLSTISAHHYLVDTLIWSRKAGT